MQCGIHILRAMTGCSIIIPVFNKAALTKQCLDALFDVMRGRHEVIVVDDASTDATPELLAGYGSRIRVIRHGINSGFAGTCNDGAAAAQEEQLVFLNNDTIPLKGWLEELELYAGEHPKAAAVGSKLLFPDDTIQHAGVIITQHRWPHHIYAGFPATHPAVNKSRKFQIVTGGCMLVRRPVYEAAGGFDTAFCNSYEDVDFCLRLGMAGHEVHYCHKSVLYHLESRTRDIRSAQEIKNNSLYRLRWADRVRPDDLDYYIEDGLLMIDYPPQYPIHLAASPMLAVKFACDETSDPAERVLNDRAKQVYRLLQANLGMMVQAREAELAQVQTSLEVNPDSDAAAFGTDVSGRNKARMEATVLRLIVEDWSSIESKGGLTPEELVRQKALAAIRRTEEIFGHLPSGDLHGNGIQTADSTEGGRAKRPVQT
jgi:GT2 family glycosyltransferase